MAKEKVLLVDDEADFTRTLAERLELRDMEVFIADNGVEALKLAGEQTLDSVILDLQMPGMDGMETLKKLLEHNPDLQVILLTGHATVDKGVEAMKHGAAEFLEKPVDMLLLTDKIGAAAAQRMVLTAERSAKRIDELLKNKVW